jgi:RNA polymerase sigma-70 factor, ECF subfamily
MEARENEMETWAFDSVYVERLSGGDPQIESHFIAYFSRLLCAKLRTRIRSPQSIDDLQQETFLRVFRTLRKQGLTNPERLGAFVNGVCNNVVWEHYRASTRVAQISGEPPDGRSRELDPEQQIQTQERSRTIYEALRTLPPKDREILKMIFLEERHKDEVCRIFGVDRRYLRVLLHRAKNRFRERLPQAARAAAV